MKLIENNFFFNSGISFDKRLLFFFPSWISITIFIKDMQMNKMINSKNSAESENCFPKEFKCDLKLKKN